MSMLPPSRPDWGRTWFIALPLLLALLLPCSAFSQTKKGFKSLDKGKWDAALEAFAADTSDETLRPVALYGMAAALANIENPNKDYPTAMGYQASAKAAWKALKPSTRKELTADYDVTGLTIDKLRTSSANAAWKAIGKTPTLQQVDAFIEAFPSVNPTLDMKATDLQGKLLETALYEAKTYADHVYLIQHHSHDIPERFPSAMEALNEQALDLFIREKGVDNAAQFFREIPKHPISRDRARDQLPTIWKATALPPLVTFLTKSPRSALVPYARKKALELLKTQPLSPEARKAMTMEERLTLGELELEASGLSVNTSKPFNERDLDAWLAFIEKTAPTYRAWSAFDKMFSHYMQKRDWKKSSELLHANAEHFPDRKRWFTDLTAIVDAPTFGVTPTDIGKQVNEGGSEYVPVPSADGKYLYFCGSGRLDNEAGEDIFMCTRKDSGWSKPVLIKELSGAGNQAPLSLTADGNRMIIFDDGRPYQSDKTATGWTEPKRLDVNTSDFAWVGLVQIAPNNQVMILEARTGGFSGTDLYVAQRQADGTWGDPVRLDTVINTAEEDRSAFLHPDMQTLYFSSAGHPGMGGLDVFMTTRLDDTWLHWSKPINLGKEINTLSDDWAYKITTDGSTAWFSNRRSSFDQNIYTVPLPAPLRPKPVRMVELSLKDDDGKPLDAEIILEDPKTGKKVGSFRTDPTLSTTFITVPNDATYNIRLQKEGYYPKSMPLPQSKADKMQKMNVAWKPVSLPDMLKKGKTEVLNVFFDYDKSELRPESMPELRNVAELAKKNNYRINLMGYTDNAGTPAYNLDLSNRRAEAA
ncbi:MAG TPA: OmpA family protein, partial [Saprospiraceae bacterium]|nr:OmpA family protein [Saprospiraceae bacterium]